VSTAHSAAVPAGAVPSVAAGGDRAPVAEIHDVSFAYGARQLVLRSVSARVYPGEFVSLIGPSGCGKSTLLMMVAGLLQPGRGEVLVHGRPITGPGPDRAVVFQNFALMPWKTVLDNVALGLTLRGRTGREARDRCMEWLGKVGLAGHERKYPYQLSGGMQQRVGLARAFACEADILLMDEPFSAIDAQNAELLQEEVRDLVRREGKTVLFVTHNLNEAIYLSDRVLLMAADPGRIVEEVVIDLPQVRGFDVPDERERLQYAAYRNRLWDHLKREVLRQKNAHGEGGTT